MKSASSENHYVPTAAFYSRLIDSLKDYSVFTLDNELRINSWNSGAKKIFQYETSEIIGQPFEIIFTQEDQANDIPKKEIQTALKAGSAVDNRWHVCKNGSKIYTNGQVFPLKGIDGSMLGYVKILRDITERKKSEEAINSHIKDLEALNAHKESVLAILSHDLRSPLARIISIAGYLKSEYDTIDRSDVIQMLSFLHESSKDELEMLDYLVEWARIKYASEIFNPAHIDLCLYLTKTIDTLYQTAAAKNLKIKNQIEENSIVYADGKMVLSILHNLISNAIKHSLNDGVITVSANRKGNFMVVQVIDKGIGMSLKTQENLFIPQINFLSQAREHNKGAGLGLLLTSNFLQKNSGEIWVKSKEGEGSVFFFSLPLNKPPDKQNFTTPNSLFK